LVLPDKDTAYSKRYNPEERDVKEIENDSPGQLYGTDSQTRKVGRRGRLFIDRWKAPAAYLLSITKDVTKLTKRGKEDRIFSDKGCVVNQYE